MPPAVRLGSLLDASAHLLAVSPRFLVSHVPGRLHQAALVHLPALLRRPAPTLAATAGIGTTLVMVAKLRGQEADLA